MINCNKLLSGSKSEYNKKLAETSRNKCKRERESYGNIHKLNYAYIQHLEIIFGTQLAT